MSTTMKLRNDGSMESGVTVMQEMDVILSWLTEYFMYGILTRNYSSHHIHQPAQ